jgi:hypothetical protein
MIDEYMAALIKDISDNIDFNLLRKYFEEDGWVYAELTLFSDIDPAREWVCENMVGDIKNNKKSWLFKDPFDATAFKLRWKCNG